VRETSALNRWLELVVAVSPEAVTLSDQELADHPIIFANPAFYRLTGYTPAEVVGQNCRLLQGPDTERRSVEVIREAIASGRSRTVELLNYRKDGTSFWNRLSLVPLRDDQGRVTHFAGFQSDVSASRRAAGERSRLQATQAVMESVTRIVQHFLEQLQHFRTQFGDGADQRLLAEYDQVVRGTVEQLQVMARLAGTGETPAPGQAT
jgi:PAS domain S-box-containing protein